jgi:hypothetical protein
MLAPSMAGSSRGGGIGGMAHLHLLGLRRAGDRHAHPGAARRHLRRVALRVLACCPKGLALVVLLPDPVEAAMLGYVCCFMLASGCALMTSRMLDPPAAPSLSASASRIGIGRLARPAGLLPRGAAGARLARHRGAGAAATLLACSPPPFAIRRSSFELRVGPRLPARRG